MSVINTSATMKHDRVWLRFNRFALLYLTICLLYTHAIGSNILRFYKPASDRYLTVAVGLVLVMALSVAFLRILATGKIAGGLPMLFLSLYAVVGIFSIMNTYLYFGKIDMRQYITGFYRSVLPAALAFLAYFLLRNVDQGFKLLTSIGVINGFLSAIGLLTYLIAERWTRFYLQLLQVESLPLHFGGVLRMTSVLWNPLLFGTLMSLNSVLAWNIILNTRKLRLLWITILVVSVIGTFTSFTRTGWVMLSVGMVISSVLLVRRVLQRILIIGTAMTGALLGLLSIPLPFGHYENMSKAILDHIVATVEYEDPREENLRVNLARIRRNPIGHGLGTAGYAALPTRGATSPVVFPNYVAADNNYLSMTLQAGITGLMFFVLAQIIALKRILRKWKTSREAKEGVILVTTLAWIGGMGVGSLFLNVWEYNLLPHLVFMLFGIGLKLCAISSRERRVQRENTVVKLKGGGIYED